MRQDDIPGRESLFQYYEKYRKPREEAARQLQDYIETLFQDVEATPLIKGRLKSFDSVYKKCISILKQNPEIKGLPPIADIIGIRIVCPFLGDMPQAEEILKNNFKIIEIERKGSNYSFKEFGYESTHILIKIPGFILDGKDIPQPAVAEVQIRTILQDAWAEVEHELVYKADFSPFDEAIKRKLAALNASLSLADTVFQEIRDYQHRLNKQFTLRRESFYRKIEEATDGLIFDINTPEPPAKPPARSASDNQNIDELLLEALLAHNSGDYEWAISTYSKILALDPPGNIKSLIYQHQGMAYFTRPDYPKAIENFTLAVEFNPKSYKALYYRGVVHSVQEDYGKALEDFNASLAINPYQPYCLFRLSEASYHLGDIPRALSLCESAIRLDPDKESFHRFRDLLVKSL
jgi:putative GTP pyrophosphokinase